MREKYEIPPFGYDDSQDAYYWEHEKKSRYHDYVSEIDSFVLEFNFPKVFLSSVKRFIYDFVLSPKRTAKSPIEDFPIFSLFKTDEDREINKYLIDPNSFYIQIFDWTTERDIMDAMKKIFQEKEEKLFYVSKIGVIARKIWLLTQDGLADKDIVDVLKEDVVELGNVKGLKIPNKSNVSNYRQRYESALRSLREFD